MDNQAARALLVRCFQAGVRAVDAEGAVVDNLTPIPGRVVVFALGKAAPKMARGAARALDRARLEGLVVTNHHDDVPDGLEVMLGNHPIPGPGSVAAGEAMLGLAATLDGDDTAVVLVSGGGSALAEAPVEGVTPTEIAATNQVLLRSGADIIATNTVRRRLSRIKGGGLAAAISPATIETLAISDVVGGDPATIASGPTVPVADEAHAALEVVWRLDIGDSLPPAVMRALAQPRSHQDLVSSHRFRIVGDGATAAHAAAAEAERLGVPARVVDTRMTGDAAAMAGEVLDRCGSGVSVFAGETTVEVSGDGVGGRNQEAALVAATLIDGARDTWFMAAGTDGIDGMTDAAGAVVDGGTVARADALGLDPGRALERNDSGGFFATLGERIVTGPTGTNVGDLWLVLRD
jgi:hydroxypyruvate reductase